MYKVNKNSDLLHADNGLALDLNVTVFLGFLLVLELLEEFAEPVLEQVQNGHDPNDHEKEQHEEEDHHDLEGHLVLRNAAAHLLRSDRDHFTASFAVAAAVARGLVALRHLNL